MNAFQLYRFLLYGPTKEIQGFFSDYGLHFSKNEVKELQQLLGAIPFYELKLPLSKKITDDLTTIIGEKKLKQLLKLLQQYV